MEAHELAVVARGQCVGEIGHRVARATRGTRRGRVRRAALRDSRAQGPRALPRSSTRATASRPTARRVRSHVATTPTPSSALSEQQRAALAEVAEARRAASCPSSVRLSPRISGPIPHGHGVKRPNPGTIPARSGRYGRISRSLVSRERGRAEATRRRASQDRSSSRRRPTPVDPRARSRSCRGVERRDRRASPAPGSRRRWPLTA